MVSTRTKLIRSANRIQADKRLERFEREVLELTQDLREREAATLVLAELIKRTGFRINDLIKTVTATRVRYEQDRYKIVIFLYGGGGIVPHNPVTVKDGRVFGISNATTWKSVSPKGDLISDQDFTDALHYALYGTKTPTPKQVVEYANKWGVS